MVRDRLLILQDFLQSSRAENVSQRGSGQETGGELGVLDVGHRNDRIEGTEIADGVHSDRYRVLGEDLLRRHVKSNGTEIDVDDRIDARQNEEEAWALGTARQNSTET